MVIQSTALPHSALSRLSHLLNIPYLIYIYILPRTSAEYSSYPPYRILADSSCTVSPWSSLVDAAMHRQSWSPTSLLIWPGGTQLSWSRRWVMIPHHHYHYTPYTIPYSFLSILNSWVSWIIIHFFFFLEITFCKLHNQLYTTWDTQFFLEIIHYWGLIFIQYTILRWSRDFSDQFMHWVPWHKPWSIIYTIYIHVVISSRYPGHIQNWSIPKLCSSKLVGLEPSND